MGLLNIIRRMHLRQNLLIREISRLTGVSRNTATKYLAVNIIEPKFATPKRYCKLDPFAEKLAGGVAEDINRQAAQTATGSEVIACRSRGNCLDRLLCSYSVEKLCLIG